MTTTTATEPDARARTTAAYVAEFVTTTATRDPHSHTGPILPMKSQVIGYLASPGVLDTSEVTARRRLHEAREAGLVHELRPGDGVHHHWGLVLPGAGEAGLAELYMNQASPGCLEHWTVSDVFNEHSFYGPGTKAMISVPDTTAEIVARFKAAKDKREADAKDAREVARLAEQDEIDRRDPELAPLLAAFRDRFSHPSEVAVRLPLAYGFEGPLSEVNLTVSLTARTPEDIATLKAVLVASLTEDERARVALLADKWRAEREARQAAKKI